MGRQIVAAAMQITESDFNGEALWIHAEPGESGVVRQTSPEGVYTVTWERTGTTTDCFASELALS